MKKFVLDLTAWEIGVPVQKTDENGKPFIAQEKIEYPLKDNLCSMLRAGGLFANTEDTVEAIMLGRDIRSCSGDSVDLDERELGLIKKCVDRHLDAATKGQGTFGGEQHEELILRVYELWTTKSKE